MSVSTVMALFLFEIKGAGWRFRSNGKEKRACDIHTARQKSGIKNEQEKC